MSSNGTSSPAGRAPKRRKKIGFYFDQAAADRAMNFFEWFLTHSKGEWAGKKFELDPWQRERIIGPLFGTKRDDTGHRFYRRADIWIPKKNGKALSIDTPLPTPDGWTTMGQVKVGDELLDERGRPCRVVAATEVMVERPCFRLEFSDGTTITADADHCWFVFDRYRERSLVRTTSAIALDFSLAKTDDKVFSRYSVELCEPLELPERPLLVAPYTLGAWLGDGHSAANRLTCADQEIFDAIRADGYRVGRPARGAGSGPAETRGIGLRTANSPSLVLALRSLGVIGNKHIPGPYLRASIPQRLALLQGLMDTDGHITPKGQAEFTTTCQALAVGIIDLIASLGYKPSMSVGEATLNGRVIGPKFRVQFWPTVARPAFRMRRKAERQLRSMAGARSTTRQILRVEACDSVPVRCVQVSSGSRLFLAGQTMIPTHNSTLAAGVGLYLALGDGEPGAEVYSVANDLDQARICWGEAARMVKKSPALYEQCQVYDSTSSIINPLTMNSYSAVGSDIGDKDGINVHGAIADEIHEWKKRDLLTKLTNAQSARRQPMTFVISTAGNDLNGVGYAEYREDKRIQQGKSRIKDRLVVIFEALPGMSWKSHKTWKAANPGYGKSVKLQFLESELAIAETDPMKEGDFKRYYLNVWTGQTGSSINLEKWDGPCAGKIDAAALAGKECFIGLDLAQRADLTAAAAIFVVGVELVVLVHFFLPEEGIEAKEIRDGVPYREWAKAGLLTITEGNLTDYSFVQAHVLRWCREFVVQEVAFDPYNASHLAHLLEAEGVKVSEVPQSTKNIAPPTRELKNLVVSGRLRHGNNPVLRWNADNARSKMDSNGNERFSKGRSAGRIDGLAAIVTALARATLPGESPSVYTKRGVISV